MLRTLILLMLTGCSSGFAPHYNLNRDIYVNHTYMTDMRKHGMSDVWELDCNVGDCEDMSLCLMQRIGRTSSLVVCENSQGGHAIVKDGGWYYDPTHGTSTQSIPCKHVFTLDYNTAMGLVGTTSGAQRAAILGKM